MIRVGQRRAVPRPAWARTTEATWSTVKPGSENEMPHRPLIWMSQKAGATQTSDGSTTDGPSTAVTEAIRSSDVTTSTHPPDS